MSPASDIVHVWVRLLLSGYIQARCASDMIAPFMIEVHGMQVAVGLPGDCRKGAGRAQSAHPQRHPQFRGRWVNSGCVCGAQRLCYQRHDSHSALCLNRRIMWIFMHVCAFSFVHAVLQVCAKAALMGSDKRLQLDAVRFVQARLEKAVFPD